MKASLNPRTLLFLALTLLCSACAKEEIDIFGSISGTVRDAQQQPIEGASVSLNPGGVIKSTGKDGSYVFIDLGAKEYTLTYAKSDYISASKETTVQAGVNNVVDITLEQEQIIPILTVSAQSLDFGTDQTTISLDISNTGKGALNWTITHTPGWFTCSPAIGTTAAGGKSSVVITASRSQKEKGTYKETFSISSNGGSCDVAVAMTVSGVNMSVTPTSLDFGAITTELQLTLSNDGESAIDYAAKTSNAWIILQKTAGKFTATDYLIVMVNRGLLSSGDYTGNVTIHAGAEDCVVPVRIIVPSNDKPSVSMEPPRDVTGKSATFRGVIESIGKDRITSHGFCWSTSPDPTISDNSTNLGDCTGPKTFESTASGLQDGTTYYVRAYAQNSAGIAYSDILSFLTVGTSTQPVVATGAVSDVATSTAKVGGTVSVLGHSAGVTKYGHVWSVSPISPDPTTSSTLSSTNFGALHQTASFTSDLTDLSPNTTYYVRAYATNAIGTAYGEERSFKTLAPPPQLTVPASLSFGADETGSKAVAVEANVAWTATKDASTWFTISDVYGNNNGQFTVTVATSNPGVTPHQGTITVAGGGMERRITVTQLGTTPQIEVSATSLDFRPDETDAKEVAVTSNVAWTASKKNNAAWLTISVTTDKITINPTANTGTAQRSETITVAGGGVTKTISVTQAAPQISLTETSISLVASEMGSRTLTVTSNIAWTATKDPATAAWLTITSSGAAGSQPLTVTVNSANTDMSPRTVTITVKGGSATQSITVTQDAVIPYISLPDGGSLSYEAGETGSKTVAVEANVAWTATKDISTWFTLTNGSGSNDGQFTITVSTPNPSATPRQGTITVSGGNAQSQSITVTQLGTTPQIDVSAASLDFRPDETGAKEVTVTANVTWTASKRNNATWLTLTNAAGKITIKPTANTGTAARSETIDVKGGGAPDKAITVTQAAPQISVPVTPISFGANEMGSRALTVTSNIPWTAVKDPATAAWLTITSSGAAGSQPLTITANSINTSTSQRSATVIVAGGGAPAKEISVTQLAVTPTLSLPTTPVTFTPTDGGVNKTVSVTSNQSWTAALKAVNGADYSWCELINPSGTGNGSFSVKAKTNNTATGATQRVAQVEVTGGGLTRTIDVSQSAPTPTLTITPSTSVSLAATGAETSKTLTVTSNQNWTTTVPTSYGSWLSATASGSGNGTITVTATTNTTTSQRTGSFTVSGGGINCTVSVTQAAPTLSMPTTPVTFTQTEGGVSKTVSVTANQSWTAALKAVNGADYSWCELINPSGTGNGSFSVKAKTNNTATGATQRVAQVEVTGGVLTRTIQVSQSAPTPTLDITPSLSVSLAATGAEASKTLTVTSNQNWTTTVPTSYGSWLSATASGSGNGTLTVTATTNTSTSQRTGSFTVSGGGINRTVSVTQAATATPTLTLPTTPVTFTQTEGGVSKTVSVTSNQNWTAALKAVNGADYSWCELINPSGTGNGSFSVKAKTNNTATGATQRLAQVEVTGGGLTRTIDVSQSAPTPTLTITPSTTVSLAATGAEASATLTVTSNQNWTTNVPTSYSSWLSATASGSGNGTITVTATTNTSTSQRTGSFTVSGGGINRTVNVAQAKYIGGTTGPLTWSLDGGTLTISGTGAMPNYTYVSSQSYSYPWYSCGSNITTVNIQDGVTTIGNYAFYGCSSLTSITIGNSVTTIGEYAFRFCGSLTSITIGNSVTTIGLGAFSGCSSLTSVTIPNSVTTIGHSAFSNCSSLTSITIPNSVTTIGECAFIHCSSLTSITIPNLVTTIGEYAFAHCSSLTSITIPNSVTTIGYQAFHGCRSLTAITVGSGNTGYASEDGVLFDKLKTTIIWYPEGRAGSYTIPNSVTTIGEWAFSNCFSLTSITIPNSITTIGHYAFAGSTSLINVTVLRASPPPILGYTVFFGVPFSSATLTVPQGSKPAYQAANRWKDFGTIVEMNN